MIQEKTKKLDEYELLLAKDVEQQQVSPYHQVQLLLKILLIQR
jgi:hypothetical protein